MKTIEAQSLLNGKKKDISSAEGIYRYYKVFKERCKDIGYEPNEFDFFYFAYCVGNNVILRERICVLNNFEVKSSQTFYGDKYDIPLPQGRKERV